MRKRLTLLICMMLISICGLFGCEKDTYEKMSITVEGASTETVGQLLIQREQDISGRVSYVYDELNFTVKVKDYGDADPNIILSGWEGYLEEPKTEYLGNGETKVTSRPLSYDSTGKFTLKIKTVEGNKSLNLQYNIDLKLEGFEFVSEKLQAVATSQEIVLEDVAGLISYHPQNTTQKDLTYSVVVPSIPSGNGYKVDGKISDNITYVSGGEDFYTYFKNNYKYAEVVEDTVTGKQVLKVYPYYLNANNQVVKVDGNPVPTVFPKIISETTSSGSDVLVDVITLRASSFVENIPDKFIDIEVVPGVGEVVLSMNTKGEQTTPINTDKAGEYNVVLVDPDYKGGLISASDREYFIMRHLTFMIESANAKNLTDEYEVVSTNVSPDDNLAVDLSMIGDANVFIVHALKKGTYTHKFTLRHSKFHGLFDQEIVVNFKVIVVPSKIDVNGTTLFAGQENDLTTTVYDVYAKGVYGSRFKVNTNSNFGYFVFNFEGLENQAVLQNLDLRRDGDGASSSFGVVLGDGTGTQLTADSNYTGFTHNSSFYLQHKFESLPQDGKTKIYIGIKFSIADESYSEQVKQNFNELLFWFPINLNIEYGINKINFDQEEYHIALEYGSNPTLLWELPEGKTKENTIKSMTFDEKNIDVLPFVEQEEGAPIKTQLYIVPKEDAVPSTSRITIETYNGIKGSVVVHTYLPTIYQNVVDLEQSPLAVEVNEDSPGYLYHMSGKDKLDHKAQWDMVINIDDKAESIMSYDSVQKLIMITNSEVDINVFDYKFIAILPEGGDYIFLTETVDVTNKVTVSFNYNNYASYSNGTIRTNGLITEDINSPIIMTIRYVGECKAIDQETGKEAHTTFTVVHKIELYIYQPIVGVTVTSAKAVDLYVADSLGYFDQELSKNTIYSTYAPDENKLGTAWNTRFEQWFAEAELNGGEGEPEVVDATEEVVEKAYKPVQKFYDYKKLLETPILRKDGSNITLISLKDPGPGQKEPAKRVVYYGDIFQVVGSPNNYEITFVCKLGEDLTDWLNNNNYTGEDAKHNILRKIFAEDIEFTVNIYVYQFNRLQNINGVTYTAKYADKVSGIELDIDDDGLYFEVRKDINGNWNLNNSVVEVEYSIKNSDAVNTKMFLSNFETAFYSAVVVENSSKTGGKIIITPKIMAGEAYLTITPQDNITFPIVPDDKYNPLSGVFYTLDSNKVLSFRIKVADGSERYPFEIRSAEDYWVMSVETKNKKNYNYVITRDIDLKGYCEGTSSVVNLDVQNTSTKFSLSGKHTFLKNGEEITVYSSIYNLSINTGRLESSSNYYLGLFGEIGSNVVLDNVSIKNAYIKVIDALKDNTSDRINIGILAGFVKGAIINSCSVTGYIDVERVIVDNLHESRYSQLSIGGMIGESIGAKISNMPGNYSQGIVATGNNSYVDIKLSHSADNSNAQYTFANKTNVGAIVGYVTGTEKTELTNLQTVSNITTNIRATIGSIVGRVYGSGHVLNIINVNVSPTITANINTEDSGSGLYAGSVIGFVESGTKYTISDVVVNFVDIGDSEDYTWQDKTNIYIYANNDKVFYGGLIGYDDSQTSAPEISTSYIRSYYRKYITDSFKGNIFVVANAESQVGGLIGGLAETSNVTLSKVYFDANLIVSNTMTKVGMIAGNDSAMTLENVYAVGLLNTVTITVVDAYNVSYTFTPVQDYTKNVIFGGSTLNEYSETNSWLGEYENRYRAYTKVHELTNVYVVANEINQFGVGQSVYGIDSLVNYLNGQNITSIFEGLGYEVTYGEDENLTDFDWFWHNTVNTMNINGDMVAYPVLLNGNKVMYDLIPEKIEVIINERDGLYNITYNEIPQVIMYLNKGTSVSDNSYYELSLDRENSAFVVKLKGSIVDTTYINVNNLSLNDKVEFLENKNETIIRIDGNKVYPVAPGVVELTVRSYVSKSVQTKLNIVVVEGLTDYRLYYDGSTDNVFEEITYVEGTKVPTENKVYIDEITDFELYPYNNLEINYDGSKEVLSGKYNANRNIGFILEILDARENVEQAEGSFKLEGINALIKINGHEYTYNELNIAENIINITDRNFKISGVTLGKFKFAITPYVFLDGVQYIDTYTSVNPIYDQVAVEGEDPVEPVTKNFDNVYLLNGKVEGSNINNMQRTYDIDVLARAIDIETSRTKVEIDARNIVNFNLILETANISFNELKTKVFIHEDIFVKINTNSYNAIFNLKDMEFVVTLDNNGTVDDESDDIYYCESFTEAEFDYALVNIRFNGLKLTKTNINVNSRNNTYKLVFSGTINFDREHYRSNANMYDLNTVGYTIQFIPESNTRLSAETLVKIVPNEITSIFTNFYSKGVDRAPDGDYETEYPKNNESTFIVPGRDGLLKITFDKEIDASNQLYNSNYITISLDNKYKDYVSLQQLAAIVDIENEFTSPGSSEILGYKNVTSLETFENSSNYGIRLSKLSLNYEDENYFNNTYYVRVLATKGINLNTLEMTISSYTSNSSNETILQISKKVTLTIMELPEINMYADGMDESVIGRGVRKELEIAYKAVTNDINFNITCLSAIEEDGKKVSINADNSFLTEENQEKFKVPLGDYLYICDDENNQVFSLNIDYLNSGRKYYLCQDVLTPSGTQFEINFNAQETLLGCIEESKDTLTLTTVDFEVDSIKFCGVKDGETFTLFHGASIPMDTQITIKDIVIGEVYPVNEYLKSITNADKDISERKVDIAEYEFAGTRVSRITAGSEEVYSQGKLNLQIRRVGLDGFEYNDMSEGYYNGITIAQSEDVYRKDGVDYLYHVLKGTTISNDTFIKLEVKYYYDANGQLIMGDEGIYFTKYIEFLVIVEDNSNYDNPVPIEDQDDLRQACSVQSEDVKKAHFILLNDIVLKDWAPTEALFNSLDGNGYKFIVESFDLSEFRGKNQADVGIFTKVSSNTLLKNIIVDVSNLLKTQNEMLNDISRMRASNQDTYIYGEGIDLGYISELNFGVLAGVNEGAITNAKIVSTTDTTLDNTKKYLHVQTTLGYINDDIVVSNIGGLVGQNTETGAISNSFVGVNTSGFDGKNYTIKSVVVNSADRLNNSADKLKDLVIYPFVLAGGNYIGGLTSINDGVISNSYAKGLGIYNTFPTVGDSATAGLVAFNNNLITSAFVEGNEIEANGVRAINNDYRIESTGYIGGLVYENNSIIENAYSNIYVQTLSSFQGGFVFVNNENATITNCYSTAVNRNSLAVGQFTGVKQGVIQNFGTYINCYYLVDTDNNESENKKEHAIAISNENDNDFSSTSSWMGFAFASGSNDDGIWSIKIGETPKIKTTLTDTVSFRKLLNVEKDIENDGVIYSYEYDALHHYGSKENPLLIDKADVFDERILSCVTKVGDEYVFASRSDSQSEIRYVRIVNNLNFESITTAKPFVFKRGGTEETIYLYQSTFNGVLDGNGMSMSNLNISTDNTGLKNFGLFAKIGYEDSSTKATVKNLNISLRTYKSTGNRFAGVLAGTVVNSTIVNVKLNGNNQTISGLNATGGIAGIIHSTSPSFESTLIDVIVENVRVEATYSSLGGTINSRSVDMSEHFYNSFTVENEGKQTETGRLFASLYDGGTVLHTFKNGILQELYGNIKNVSYAGGVAGIILAHNNNSKSVTNKDISNYRSKVDESTIDNVVVRGDVVISTADNSGGLFGYVGEDTLIRSSKLEVSDNQLIKAFNNIGGIVGENHGFIEQVSVEYDAETQKDYDATILDNNSNMGTFNLFDMAEGEPYYSVSIGGIAGYSDGGAIIDSYVKVNVIKELSFIAGGIIGYANGNNFLGNVYNTGAVYARDVVGGVIGLHIADYVDDNKITTNVYMTNVVSLTNWNTSDDTLNVRDEISKKLYSNYKFMYESEEKYSNFYIKMPEVGNAPIDHTEEIVEYENGSTKDVQTVREESYRNNHNIYYIGSVVGKMLLDDKRTDNAIRKEYQIYDGDTDEETNYHVFTSNGPLESVYSSNVSNANVSNVFSSTLGIMSSSGDLPSGTREDKFFETKFTVQDGEDNSFDSYSYRVAYNNDDLNGYELKESSTDEEEFLDKFTFSKIFTSQEYKQQLLGRAYRAEYFDEDQDKTIACMSTKNIFVNGYNENRYLAGGDKFVSSDDIWTMEDNLPKFYIGMQSAISVIESFVEFENALKNTVTGKTYRIKQNIDLDISHDEDIKYIQYFNGIKSTFVGDNSSNTQNKAKITFDVEEGTNYIASIFQLWNGATFQNIDFIINIDKDNFTNSKIDYTNYGLLANTLDGVYIKDCSFTIIIENDYIANSDKESESVFNAENVGILFGAVNNSNIIDTSFTINAKAITIANDKINNFGLFAGNISGSNFRNVSFDITTDSQEIEISGNHDIINVGGLAGSVITSKFTQVNGLNVDIENIKDTSNIKTKQDAEKTITYERNIAGVFGYASRLNFSGIKADNSILNSTIKFGISDVNSESTLNTALFIGKSNQSQLDGVEIKTETPLTFNIGSEDSSLSTSGNINVGTIIGYDESNSQIGLSDRVGCNSNITVYADTYNLSVGGLVGYIKSSYQAINNAYYDGNISVTNYRERGKTTENVDSEDKTTYIDVITFVGGILGRAQGRVGIDSVLSAGNISLVLTHQIEEHFKAGVGGIIGGAYANVEITNFVTLNNLTSGVDVYDDSKDGKEAYSCISGVLGYNGGLFTGKYGYSYVELPKMTNAITSSITHGLIATNCKNIYYAQEFIGNNYVADTYFKGYAMADLYGTVSEFSPIYSLLEEDDDTPSKMKKNNIGTLEIVVPESLDGCYVNAETNTKFNPRSLNGEGISDTEIVSSDNKYNVIIANLENKTFTSLGENNIISGRNTENGKVVITISALDGLKYFVGTNNGVISNVYLNTGLEIVKDGNKTANNVALVEKNNGLITNVYVYGVTTCNYTIAETNDGRIYASASSVKFLQMAEKTALYGLVVNNGSDSSKTGAKISDCYSESFGYTESNDYKTNVYGFAKVNYGSIEYSYYYIPQDMMYDNNNLGYVEGIKVGATDKIDEKTVNKNSTWYNNPKPSSLIKRSNIWVEEESKVNLIGITDPVGSFVIRVLFNGVEISSVSDLKDKINNASSDKSNIQPYKITYDIDFYVDKENLPSYKVVRITNSDDFIKYLATLTDGCIPTDTIVMFTNDNSKLPQNSHIINMDATNLNKISILDGSAIVGVNMAGTDDKITLDFKPMNGKEDEKQNIMHEFISSNYGVIAGLKITNVKFTSVTDNSELPFAPIVQNIGGVIDNLEFVNIDVVSNIRPYVAGIVGNNTNDGLVSNCVIDNIYLSSRTFINEICINYESIDQFVNNRKVSSSYSGDYWKGYLYTI